MIEVDNLSVSYGGVRAVRGACMTIREAAVTCLIGRNGSGKSSLVQAIAGLMKSEGTIALDDEDINHLSATHRARVGISLVPEDRRVFGSLSVRENLLLGAKRATSKDRLDKVLAIFPAIGDFLDRGGHQISGGQQQMVAIGRALMRSPRLLILDEPSLGLAPLVVAEVFKAVDKIARDGQSVLLIEQNARAALDVSHFAYAMALGEVTYLGQTDSLTDKLDLGRLYL